MDRRLLIAIVSFVLIGGSYGLVARKIDKAPRDESWFWVDKMDWKDQFDIVIAGDSRVNRGIDPLQFQNEKTANFGFSGQGWSQDYLDRIPSLLSPNGKKIILLGISARSFTDTAVKSGDFSIWKSKRNFDLWSQKSLSRFELFFTSENPLILLGRAASSSASKYNQSHEPYGWMPTTRSSRDRESAMKEYQDLFTANKVNPENIDRVANQTKEWIAKGYRIYIFNTPVSAEIKEIEEALSGMPMTEIQRRLTVAGATLLHDFQDSYETFDGHHLERNSAIEFSKELARRLDLSLR